MMRPSAGAQRGRYGIVYDPEQQGLESTGRECNHASWSKERAMTITEMDGQGRILLPLQIRVRLNLNAGDALAIDSLRDGTIIITKAAER